MADYFPSLNGAWRRCAPREGWAKTVEDDTALRKTLKMVVAAIR